MNYLGFLCLGLGILTLVIGLICALLSFASHEIAIKIKAKRLAVRFLPCAFLLLMVGLRLSATILFPTQ